jgi:hypothetical protein
VPVVKTQPEAGTNAPKWTLDVATAFIPDSPAAGKIHGRRFTCDRAIFQGGALSLIHGTETVPESSVTVFLFAQRPEHLTGKSLEVGADRTGRRPRVLMGWRTGQQPPVTETVETGYALQIAFGNLDEGKLPGIIFLGVPDEKKSFVAGTFMAEVLKPEASKPTGGTNLANKP